MVIRDMCGRQLQLPVSYEEQALAVLPLVKTACGSAVEGAQFFSGLDLTSFFYQIRVEPEDVPLTAMRTIY